MGVHFRDVRGETGIVTEELDVEYTGPWRSDVRDCLERAKEAAGSDGEGPTAEVFSYLVIELPDAAPVVSVGLEEATGT